MDASDGLSRVPPGIDPEVPRCGLRVAQIGKERFDKSPDLDRRGRGGVSRAVRRRPSVIHVATGDDEGMARAHREAAQVSQDQRGAQEAAGVRPGADWAGVRGHAHGAVEGRCACRVVWHRGRPTIGT
jgi:hypothetical protein